jgi:hypothetical protein
MIVIDRHGVRNVPVLKLSRKGLLILGAVENVEGGIEVLYKPVFNKEASFGMTHIHVFSSWIISYVGKNIWKAILKKKITIWKPKALELEREVRNEHEDSMD